MKRTFLFAGIGLALLAGLAAWWFFRETPQRNTLRTRELATWGLADHLARTLPGRRVVVLSNPFVQRSETAAAVREAEAAGLRGLKRGFGPALALEAVAFPPLKPGAETNPRAFFIDPETTTPLSYLVAPDAFDRVVQAHPQSELVISLIGLPVDLGRVACWRGEGPPRFALLLPDLRLIGDVAVLRGALARGKIAALVLARPGAPDAQLAPQGDLAAEFERRFVLVTSNSLEQIARTYPGLFPRR